MKKIIVLFLLVVTFVSCSDDLTFSTPAFQAQNNGLLWKATTFRANVDALGKLTITAIRSNEVINLTTSSTQEIVYNLGNTLSVAVFENREEVVFTTNNIPDPSIQLYPSEGEIEITEYNPIERMVSGTFSFNAFDGSGLNSENFNRGVFHNVPIQTIASAGGTLQDVLCDNAVIASSITLNNLNAVDPAGPSFTQFCNAYKDAIQNEIAQCGDIDLSLQAIIDGLGDCSN